MIETNYERNRRQHFVESLLRFLRRRTEWRGTPTSLANEIWKAAEGQYYRDWLPMGKSIRRELEAYRPFIAKRGWTWTEGRNARERWIELRKRDESESVSKSAGSREAQTDNPAAEDPRQPKRRTCNERPTSTPEAAANATPAAPAPAATAAIADAETRTARETETPAEVATATEPLTA